MRNSKIDNVINLTASERYDYFIRKLQILKKSGA